MEDLDDILETGVKDGRVDLSHRGYKQFDTGIFSLATTLSAVDLSHNSIDVIPEEISSLICLSELRLNNNEIREIPAATSFLKKLSILDVSENQLVEVPKEIADCVLLKELSLNGNQIRHLPESIGELKLLKKLHVRKNRLSLIPFNLSLCISLEEVDFSENPDITNVPEKHLRDVRLIVFLCGHYKQCSATLQTMRGNTTELEQKLEKAHCLKVMLREKVEDLQRREKRLLLERPMAYLRVKKELGTVASVLCIVQ